MSKKAAFIFHPDALRYRFNDEHPFNQQRLALTIDLLKELGALSEADIHQPSAATEADLSLAHTADYIEAVKALSAPVPSPEWENQAAAYGLDTQDTPYYPGMHQITSVIVGGSLEAAKRVMSGETPHALHLGGGLHHALTDKGAGFCVYNDASVAIAWIKRHYDAKVLYVDTDVHHGDGVQWSFYNDPQVCTFSIHESGDYLFPGTGFVTERGQGAGIGTCFNMPVEPYTEDDSWLECFEDALAATISRFRPDVIVSQHGCDAHFFDPLSHICCSMRVYHRMPRFIHDLAHQWCDGKWIALGGGGYDIWRVVPRAWSLVWLAMINHPLTVKLDAEPLTPLPRRWLDRWQPKSPDTLVPSWLDPAHLLISKQDVEQIRQKNKQARLALLS